NYYRDLLEKVFNINEHFMNITDFRHVFRMPELNRSGVNKERIGQIFQLYGYTFADSYETLKKNFKAQLKEALKVDTSRYKIRISKEVKFKFEQSGIPIFKTI